MWQLVARTFEQLVLPPGLFLVLLAASLFLLSKRPALGKASVYAVMIAFYFCSTPYFAGLLISQVESYPALDASSPGDPSAGAIVLLSGDLAVNATEYGSDTVGGHSLLRTRYAAFLQRKTGLPILVSGGLLPRGATRSLAQVMAETLKQDFNAGEVWLEDKSLSTAENALFSKTVLAKKQTGRIYLVTQAWHMPRAVAVFEKAGLSVIPAPTAFLGTQAFNWNNILPSPGGIRMSRYALREMAAHIWYKILY
jgi:uncharacterized SAM-binding protein YcdF (DUF218 family)